MDCWNLINFGFTYEWEINIDARCINHYHPYLPDNLAFLERKYEKSLNE